MKLSAKESGLVFSLFLGIQKIRLSGAQQRAFGKWAKQYTEKVKLEYHPPFFIRLEPVMRMAVLLIGNIPSAENGKGVAELRDYFASCLTSPEA